MAKRQQFKTIRNVATSKGGSVRINKRKTAEQIASQMSRIDKLAFEDAVSVPSAKRAMKVNKIVANNVGLKGSKMAQSTANRNGNTAFGWSDNSIGDRIYKAKNSGATFVTG